MTVRDASRATHDDDGGCDEEPARSPPVLEDDPGQAAAHLQADHGLNVCQEAAHACTQGEMHR